LHPPLGLITRRLAAMAIDLLDTVEPDPDAEDDAPTEPVGDEEPSLGWTAHGVPGRVAELAVEAGADLATARRLYELTVDEVPDLGRSALDFLGILPGFPVKAMLRELIRQPDCKALARMAAKRSRFLAAGRAGGDLAGPSVNLSSTSPLQVPSQGSAAP
jgi:hypothetical protein